MEAYIAFEKISQDHWKNGLARVIYFAGCDYQCPWCNTPEFLKTKEEYVVDLKSIKSGIRESSQSIKAVVFSGGEPCLQRQALISLATFAKDMGLKVGLETNGSKTECIRSLLSLGIVDMVAMDLKSPLDESFEKATKSQTFFKSTGELMHDVKATLKLLRSFQDKVDIEFRTTIVPALNNRKELLYSMGSEIEDIQCVWVLQQYTPHMVDDKKYSRLIPPSEEFLANLKNSVQNRFPNIRIHSGLS